MRPFLIVWLAQGLGIGRIPIMPGTFGSALGLGWLGLLLLTNHLWLMVGLSLGLTLACIYICDEAERILNARDPGSIVLDEIIAIPFCYLPWIIFLQKESGELPQLIDLFSGEHWKLGVGIFILFRVFDMVKPYPIRQVQAMHGGWGVTLDDLLAAVYVAGVQAILAFWF